MDVTHLLGSLLFHLNPQRTKVVFLLKTTQNCHFYCKEERTWNLFFGISNWKILYLTSTWTHGRNFRNFDHVHCRFMHLNFKVKKTSFLATRLSAWLDVLASNLFSSNFLHYWFRFSTYVCEIVELRISKKKFRKKIT